MNDSGDLVTWLQAQFDTDERLAGDALHPDAVNPGQWTTEHHNSKTHAEPNRCHIAEDKGGNYWSVAHEVFIPNAEHMANWDPARALAEVESKRLILRRWEGLRAEAAHWEAVRDADCLTAARSAEQAVGTLVRALAVAYRHRDGWRQEWAA